MYTYFLELFNDLPFVDTDTLGVFAVILALFVMDRVCYIIGMIFRRR